MSDCYSVWGRRIRTANYYLARVALVGSLVLVPVAVYAALASSRQATLPWVLVAVYALMMALDGAEEVMGSGER